MPNPREDEKPVPELIRDKASGKAYEKGRFFGKGGFARCYEITELTSKKVFAGKIVSKSLLTKNNHKEKMSQEIEIHKSLSHKRVVQFHGFFEDSDFVYVVLELCRKRSLMELHKRRKALTEPEVRFFMKQILEGVLYLHEKRIIHRDLKLGNLFLNDNLEVKIGDFGLAARIEYTGQRKKTLCGTPNYIAPEILKKKGHSFEVDIWSIGCIMYTLLVGKPPFETNTLQETYAKIKRCEYNMPAHLDESAAYMVHQMLQPEPSERPTVKALLEMDFIKTGYCPKELPASCLTMAPRFDSLKEQTTRKPLREVNPILREDIVVRKPREEKLSAFGSSSVPVGPSPMASKCSVYLRLLHSQLVEFFNKKPPLLPDADAEEMTDPVAQPFVWVSKWVDYSDKYGFGYQLCDDGVGVMFNDSTKVVLFANQRNVHYIEKDGAEHYHMMGSTPPYLEKKMKLLHYFRRYMNDHLMKAGASVPLVEADSLSRVPHLHMWHRSSSSVIMQLTNGTVQMNFMDHTKIIMCPLMEAVTFIDDAKNFRTYRFSTLGTRGCPRGLQVCLDYAVKKLGAMVESS